MIFSPFDPAIMNITVVRRYYKTGYTISDLYIAGVLQKYQVMEPFDAFPDRDGLTVSPAEVRNSKLVYGKIAILKGSYAVRLTVSPKFRAILPLVCGTDGFDGILFHSGNTPADTRGCLLLGYNSSVGMLSDSRDALEDFLKVILSCTISGDPVLLTIVSASTFDKDRKSIIGF